MAQFLFGCVADVLNSGQSVISSPTVGRGNLKLPKIELKKFSGDLRNFFNIFSKFERMFDDMEEEAYCSV
jgi:hypothetical protein